MQRWAETHCRCAVVSENVMWQWQSRSWIYWKHFAEVLIHKVSLLSQKLAPCLSSHVYAVEVCKGLHWFQAALGFNTQMYRSIAAGRCNVTRRSKNPLNSAISFNSHFSWFWHCSISHMALQLLPDPSGETHLLDGWFQFCSVPGGWREVTEGWEWKLGRTAVVQLRLQWRTWIWGLWTSLLGCLAAPSPGRGATASR